MSAATQTSFSANEVFQSHFGQPPGSQDPKSECEQWQRLCTELLAERERLRTELEKARLEQIMREWDATSVPPTWDAACAIADRTTSLEQIIADMRKNLEAQK